jgi:hypothetical protein
MEGEGIEQEEAKQGTNPIENNPESAAAEAAAREAEDENSRNTKQKTAENAIQTSIDEAKNALDPTQPRFKTQKSAVNDGLKKLKIDTDTIQKFNDGIEAMNNKIIDIMNTNKITYHEALSRMSADLVDAGDAAKSESISPTNLEIITGVKAEQGDAIAEVMRKQGAQLLSNIDSPELTKQIRKLMAESWGPKGKPKAPERINTNNAEIARKQTDAAGEINDPNATEAIERNQTKAGGQEASEGRTPSDWTAKDILKAIFILIMAGGASFGLWSLIEFCKNHSGCMLIVNETGDSESQTKIICGLNTSNATTTYPPQLCRCPEGPPFSPPSAPPSTPACVAPGNQQDTTPLVGNVKGQVECVGDIMTGKAPYKYYTYRVMTPFGALLNIGSQIGSGVEGFFDNFLKLLPQILMWAGIGVGGIILILIIYKVIIHFIEKRKSSSG